MGFEAEVMILTPVFSLTGTDVKASGMGARRPVDVCFAWTGVERRRSSPMPQAAFYGDWEICRYKQGFRALASRKPCLYRQ